MRGGTHGSAGGMATATANAGQPGSVLPPEPEQQAVPPGGGSKLKGKSSESSAKVVPLPAPAPSSATLVAARRLAARGFEGWGTPGGHGVTPPEGLALEAAVPFLPFALTTAILLPLVPTGTVPRREVRAYRWMAVVTQVLGCAYLVWRALRTLSPSWAYFYSIPFWLLEFLAYILSFCFFTRQGTHGVECVVACKLPQSRAACHRSALR